MLYRALGKLSIGVKRGGIFRSNRISREAAEILLQRDRIAVVQSPPVSAVPRLELAAEKLEAAGITSVADIVDTDAIEGVGEEELDILKSEAIDALTASDDGCQGCDS